MKALAETYKWIKRCTRALIFVALASGILTFRGIQSYGLGGDNSFFNSVFGPILLTSVSVLVAVFGWKYIFENYPRSRTPEEKSRMLIIMAFVTVVLLSTAMPQVKNAAKMV